MTIETRLERLERRQRDRVATGSTSGSRRARWIAKLVRNSVVLVALDADDAGEKARRWWLSELDNAAYWCPAGAL